MNLMKSRASQCLIVQIGGVVIIMQNQLISQSLGSLFFYDTYRNYWSFDWARIYLMIIIHSLLIKHHVSAKPVQVYVSICLGCKKLMLSVITATFEIKKAMQQKRVNKTVNWNDPLLLYDTILKLRLIWQNALFNEIFRDLMLKVHKLISMCWIIYIHSKTDAWYLQQESSLWLGGSKLTLLTVFFFFSKNAGNKQHVPPFYEDLHLEHTDVFMHCDTAGTRRFSNSFAIRYQDHEI